MAKYKFTKKFKKLKDAQSFAGDAGEAVITKSKDGQWNVNVIKEAKKRDYKDEYKKFQSSTKSKKYRAELNKYNRDKGTYGNGDGKDASHKGGKIVGFETESKNRGRAEKSRLKKKTTENITMNEQRLRKMIREVLSEAKFKDIDVKKLGKKKTNDLMIYLFNIVDLGLMTDMKTDTKKQILSVNISKISQKVAQNIQKRFGVDLTESKLNEGKKKFRVNSHAIGKAKYSIDFHDGKSTHKDGSPFWGINIFNNKKDLAKAIKDYTKKGYIKESTLNETKYRGYEIKRQNRKNGLPFIIPALQRSASNMKDAKKQIDKFGNKKFMSKNESINEASGKEKVFVQSGELWISHSTGSGKTTRLRGRGYFTDKKGDKNFDSDAKELAIWAKKNKPIKKKKSSTGSIVTLFKIPEYGRGDDAKDLSIWGGEVKPNKWNYMVVSSGKINVIMVFDNKPEAMSWIGHTAESVNEAKESPIDIAKRVVKNKQHEKGLDLTTANYIIQVYDKLNPKNKKKIEKLPLKKLVDLVWKLPGY